MDNGWTLGKGIAVGLIAISIMGIIIGGFNFVEFLIREDKGCNDYYQPRPVIQPCEVINISEDGTRTCITKSEDYIK